MTQHTHNGYHIITEAEPVKDINVYMHDSGLVATHDYSCPVCRENHAVLNLGTGVMQPCWSCREKGYITIKAKRTWWNDFLFKWLTGEDRR